MILRKAPAVLGAVLIMLALLLTGCAQPLDFDFNDNDSSSEDDESNSDDHDSSDPDDSDAVAVAVSGESFTLAWDPASGDITAYEVFYRSRGDSAWSELGEAPVSSEPSYEVSNSELSYGMYEFAVRAKLEGGDATDYHTSLDSTADPESGWYVDWSSG